MKTGEFRIKSHSGFHTYHGFVKLEIEQSIEDEIVGSDPYDLSIPEKNAYTSAVIFGIHYGLKEYRRKTSDRTRFRVKVLKLIGVSVDTSPIIIAYVTGKAVLNAFQLDDNVDWPLLKEEEGLFVFRK